MFKNFFRVLSILRVVIHDGKPIKKFALLLSYPGTNAREICTCNSCGLIEVKINSLCCFRTYYEYVSVIGYGENQGKKTVPTSQIIEGWASHDPLSRTRLYFIYFQTCFCLSGTGFALILTEDFVCLFQASR